MEIGSPVVQLVGQRILVPFIEVRVLAGLPLCY